MLQSCHDKYDCLVFHSHVTISMTVGQKGDIATASGRKVTCGHLLVEQVGVIFFAELEGVKLHQLRPVRVLHKLQGVVERSNLVTDCRIVVLLLLLLLMLLMLLLLLLLMLLMLLLMLERAGVSYDN